MSQLIVLGLIMAIFGKGVFKGVLKMIVLSFLVVVIIPIALLVGFLIHTGYLQGFFV